MLYIQQINIQWEKDVRYANYANARRSIRFFPVDFNKKDINNIILHNCINIKQSANGIYNCQDTKILDDKYTFNGRLNANNTFFGKRVYIGFIESENKFKIFYNAKTSRTSIKPIFSLQNGQTGRIIYNYRSLYEYSGIWFYKQVIFNFVCAEKDDFKQKIFYVKNPDFVFEDLKMMSYNGN